ncbi:MAG: radical SAM protein [Thermodesulfobacteriota bacterium]
MQSTDRQLIRRRERAKKLVRMGKLTRQFPYVVMRNPLGALKWIETVLLDRRASAYCYNYPFLLQIEVTNACNLKCKMCPRERELEKLGQKASHMTFDTFKQIMDSWIGHLYQIYLFGRGEPLMAPDLPRMIHYCAQKGVPYITLNTNGTLLRGKMAQALADSELDEIRISIDGADEEGFKAVRGISLQQLKDNITDFRRISDIPIHVTTTVSQYNWETVHRIPDLCAEIGVHTLRLLPSLPYVYVDMPESTLTPDQKKEFKTLVRELKASCEQKKILFISASPRVQECKQPFIMAFIDVEGNLTPCCLLEITHMGNVLKDGFAKVWRGDQMNRWRKLLLKHQFPKACLELECIRDW